MALLEGLGLDPLAETVYRTMLDNPRWRINDIVRHLQCSEEDVLSALDRLADLALLRRSLEDPGDLRPVNPAVGLQALLRRRQMEEAERQLEMAQSKAAVAQMLAQYADQERSDGDAVRLVGIDVIIGRLEQLSEEVGHEVLTFMPGGSQSANALETARQNDERALGRGVKFRNICLDSVRNDSATLAYLNWLVEAGAHVRTMPVLPPRMIIFDRTVAIVPMDPDNSRRGALQLSGAGIIAALLALFEQVWEIAVPLGSPALGPQGFTRQQHELLRMLAEGMTDEVAAKRLGVSERTVRRMMAEIMERIGARSRFEAGLRVAERGWL
ncbi:LuxR C-terminal-related transcriptional regulator [Microbispora bryophytorum]|uniref:LuxR C-terminal-related transcriptional regulator n=2 Tax=Microbispora bryophytorum TaxID=1460882 RepID=UPI003723C84C